MNFNERSSQLFQVFWDQEYNHNEQNSKLNNLQTYRHQQKKIDELKKELKTEREILDCIAENYGHRELTKEMRLKKLT